MLAWRSPHEMDVLQDAHFASLRVFLMSNLKTRLSELHLCRSVRGIRSGNESMIADHSAF